MKKFFLFLLLVPAMLVQAATQITCAEARSYALSVSANNELYNGGEMYMVQGYVTYIQTPWNSGYKNVSFWVADTENGGKVIQAYRCVANTEADAPNVGALVRVTGQLTKYNTTPEFAQGCTCEMLTIAEDPVNLGPKTIAEFINLANTKDTCVLTGVVTSITDSDRGRFYIADNTGSIYVFGMANFSSYGIEAGDTLTLQGVYSLYGSTPEVVGAQYISHVQPAAEVPVTGSLRVCAQNLQNYYFNPNTGRGDYTEAEIAAKTRKIVNAMLNIDADIYAFCEVEAKPIVLQQLADSMNAHAGASGRYVPVSDNIDQDWTADKDYNIKSGFIYRTDKVATVGNNTGAVSGNGYYAHTMRLQAFRQLSDGEKLVVSMNHFKAKDSSEDAGEGQRQTNATNLLSALNKVNADPDILILGDLNCQVGETPITMIINAGYEEQLLKYNANAWSHCWGNGELIDHVFANASMAEQIVNAYVKHVSAYKCNSAVSSSQSWSDHDPYVVEINLSAPAIPETPCEDIDATYLTSGMEPMTSVNNYWYWYSSEQYGSYAKVSKQGGYTDYMMTPIMNMSDMSSVAITFQHAHKFAGTPSEELTLWVTPDFQGDVESSTWQQLTISPYAANTNWTFVDVSIDVPTEYLGPNTVFAFKYMSTASNYATWEIKNLHITAECGEGQGAKMENINEQKSAQKILRQGQIIIIRSGVAYTITGQRL